MKTVTVKALADVLAYPDGINKLVIEKGAEVILGSLEASFLLKRELVSEVKAKETKPAPQKKKETKPALKAKKTKKVEK